MWGSNCSASIERSFHPRLGATGRCLPILLWCAALTFANAPALLVKFKPAVAADEAAADFCRRYSVSPRHARPSHGILSFVIPRGMSVTAARQLYGGDPRVEFCEPDYVFSIVRMPDDSLFPLQWSLYNPARDRADVKAPEAWALYTGSRRIIIAIVDTGIDYLHPDLAGNIWTNPGEVPGNNIDDDLNGFVDDIHGWDFTQQNVSTINIMASGDPMDRNSHGTHCAGIVGAVTGNCRGIAGVNHQVSLMACKGLDDQGAGYTSDLVNCIYYAVESGARIISASWGGGDSSQALFQAIMYADAHNVMFVAAAGNNHRDIDGVPFYPAGYGCPNIVSVGAFGADNARAPFSNWGKKSVDIFAPGALIMSTVPGGRYRTYSGTSMAAPHVSGALGLLAGFLPDANCPTYIEALLATVDRGPAYRGLAVCDGRLNIYQALQALLPNRRVAVSHGSFTVPPPVLRYLESERKKE